MYESELWWKGGKENGTIGRANDLQILVNQQARDIDHRLLQKEN